MNVQVLSDVHLEFYANAGQKVMRKMRPKVYVDMVIIAGDLTIAQYLKTTLKTVCDNYKDVPVLYVPGNHEYYHSSMTAVYDIKGQLMDPNSRIYQPNLHWFDNNVFEYGGHRFLGTTLWFRDHPMNDIKAPQLSDFRYITGFRNWVYVENKKAIDFLEGSVQKGDVVITHHLPTQASVGDENKTSELNEFFVCDMTEFIFDRMPNLWIHGHGHECRDYVLGETRILANPQGYPREGNKSFGRHLVIEI